MARTTTFSGRGGTYAPELAPSEGAGGRPDSSSAHVRPPRRETATAAPIPIEHWSALVEVKFAATNLQMCRRTFLEKFGPYLTPCRAPHERGRQGKLWFRTEQIRALIDEWTGGATAPHRPQDGLDPRFLANELERRFK